MILNPYLNFNGQCREAFEFYAKCLGGKIEMMLTAGETPMADKIPADRHDKIMHVRLVVDGFMLMGSDVPPDMYTKPQGFSVTLNMEDPVAAGRIFDALAERGTVQMPLQQTFWAQRFGTLVDRFGTPWMINCAPAA